jgi:sugar phosphate isomerase/epimerase
MAEPRFSVSQFTTLNRSFEEDLEAFVAGGAEGIGIADIKIPEGRDGELLARFRASGLKATVCLPSPFSVLPLPLFPGPEDPEERVESLCVSVRRLAPFEPVTVLCLTGPAGARDPAEARRIAVEGLREVARTGRELGVQVVLEPIHASARDEFSLVTTIPGAAELAAEVGEPLGVHFDTWHLWDTPDVLAHIAAHAREFRAVHINDWREETRGWDDRALPGEGIIDLPAIFGALDAGGFEGWYDMEVFSGEAYPDSLQKLDPAEVVRRGKAGFLRAWEARRVPA